MKIRELEAKRDDAATNSSEDSKYSFACLISFSSSKTTARGNRRCRCSVVGSMAGCARVCMSVGSCRVRVALGERSTRRQRRFMISGELRMRLSRAMVTTGRSNRQPHTRLLDCRTSRMLGSKVQSQSHTLPVASKRRRGCDCEGKRGPRHQRVSERVKEMEPR